ncbi:MAG: hypothetical protein QF805_21115, partial [Pirellulaceae bacterium]|nr:hypothetical protein [Pirellulaceae bacterium]
MSTHSGNASVIEFPCGGCRRLLKVPAAASGRPAKCPQCGMLQTVPDDGPEELVMQTSTTPTPPATPELFIGEAVQPTPEPTQQAPLQTRPQAPPL